MSKQTYTVVFERGDRPNQWLATVREIPECHTFGRGLAQTRARVREALVLWEGPKAESAEIVEELPVPAEVEKVKLGLASLEAKLQDLLLVRERMVTRLRNDDWSQRDIAEVLGVSHQRVGQVSRKKAKGRRRGYSAEP